MSEKLRDQFISEYRVELGKSKDFGTAFLEAHEAEKEINELTVAYIELGESPAGATELAIRDFLKAMPRHEKNQAELTQTYSKKLNSAFLFGFLSTTIFSCILFSTVNHIMVTQKVASSYGDQFLNCGVCAAAALVFSFLARSFGKRSLKYMMICSLALLGMMYFWFGGQVSAMGSLHALLFFCLFAMGISTAIVANKSFKFFHTRLLKKCQQ
jgi:hypothetical protein